MDQSERRAFLIRELLDEDARYRDMEVPAGEKEQKRLLRGLMNIRLPKKISREFLAVQDAYLKAETASKGIARLDDLQPVSDGLYLWQRDITTLRCDAIVNAANSGMTGCYVPNHKCIDNCIHTYSGIQLRIDCEKIMRAQIAVRTVKEFMKKETSVRRVIFNVFKDLDKEIYSRLLSSCTAAQGCD